MLILFHYCGCKDWFCDCYGLDIAVAVLDVLLKNFCSSNIMYLNHTRLVVK